MNKRFILLSFILILTQGCEKNTTLGKEENSYKNWKKNSNAVEIPSSIQNEDGNNGAEISNDGSGKNPVEHNTYKKTVSTPPERDVNAASPDSNPTNYTK